MLKAILSSMLGNALEWYDFALYGHFASLISRLFFPEGDSFINLIATYSIFAAGFIMRPLGGIFFGWLGDKFGRRISLAASILLMAVPTACIGLLPTYEKIGILAPILLCIIRLLQGLSMGGEFSGCMTFLVEFSPPKHRGLVGSISMSSLVAGMLMGTIVASIATKYLSKEEFELWGWRIPFLLGIVIGVVGVYIRTSLHESPIYLKAKEHKRLSSQPVRDVFTKFYKQLFIGIGVYLALTVPFFTFCMFVKTFMYEKLGYSYSDSLLVNLISLSVAMVLMPLSAWISDIIGRKKVLVATSIGFIIFIYPIFWILLKGGLSNAIISQLLFAIFVGFYMGPIPALLVELFPTKVRFTGVALSYNISAALFGGTAPLAGTWLIEKTGMLDIMGAYIILFVTISLISYYFYEETSKKPLEE